MARSRLFAPALILAASLVAPLCPGPAVAEDKMAWRFSEANEAENKGALTARLIYGVPETDDIQVSGVCEGRFSSGAKSAALTFAADIGSGMRAGDEVKLRFSGGGFERTLKGSAHHPQSEEDFAGVDLTLDLDDPLWKALLGKDHLDYLVPGYRARSLDLTRGRDQIRSFLDACRAYSEAVLGKSEPEASPDPPPDRAAQEREAFESTKELGTAAAWDAFLTNYPSGFHADLARAYVKKLKAAPPMRAPQVAGNPGVNGFDVTSVDYGGGVFLMNGATTWVEQRRAGGDALRFVETFRSEREVRLFDKRRNVHVTLDITGGTILSASGSAPLKKLYDIVAVQGGGGAAAFTAPPPPAAITPVQAPARIQPKCGNNFQLSKGKCVPIQNCGRNASRNSKGVCHCKKGFVNRNGACERPRQAQRPRQPSRAGDGYHDAQGNLLPGYVYGPGGMVMQDNAGGE